MFQHAKLAKLEQAAKLLILHTAAGFALSEPVRKTEETRHGWKEDMMLLPTMLMTAIATAPPHPILAYGAKDAAVQEAKLVLRIRIAVAEPQPAVA